jgi:hypothetical protein
MFTSWNYRNRIIFAFKKKDAMPGQLYSVIYRVGFSVVINLAEPQQKKTKHNQRALRYSLLRYIFKHKNISKNEKA